MLGSERSSLAASASEGALEGSAGRGEMVVAVRMEVRVRGWWGRRRGAARRRGRRDAMVRWSRASAVVWVIWRSWSAADRGELAGGEVRW